MSYSLVSLIPSAKGGWVSGAFGGLDFFPKTIQCIVKGLETELDWLTSRLVSAMANRDSLEEVLVSVIYFILSNLLSFQLRFS